MIAVNKEKIDRLLPEETANISERAFIVGRAVDQVDGLTGSEKKMKKPAIGDEQIEGDDRRDRRQGVAEQKVCSTVGGPNFAETSGALDLDIVNGGADLFQSLQSAAPEMIAREGESLVHVAAAL